MTAPKADSEKKFKDACNDGSIKSFTVAEIKEFLKARDIPASGIKTFLITLVKEHKSSQEPEPESIKNSETEKSAKKV